MEAVEAKAVLPLARAGVARDPNRWAENHPQAVREIERAPAAEAAAHRVAANPVRAVEVKRAVEAADQAVRVGPAAGVVPAARRAHRRSAAEQPQQAAIERAV